MKLLFLDLDGTLLTDDKTISDVDMEGLDLILEKGHKIIINSGRPLYSILVLAKRYNLLKDGIYFSSYNGGQIYDYGSKTTLKADYISDEAVRFLLDKAYELNVHAHTYTDDYIVSEIETDELKFYSDRIKMPYKLTDDFSSETKGKAPKVIVISKDDHEILERYRKETDFYTKDKMYVTFSNPMLLEFANPNTSKGKAVEFMCDYFDVDIKDSIACGDEENDLPMIETAGVGVCMKNGVELLKSAADYITEKTNNEGGIREVIEKFIL